MAGFGHGTREWIDGFLFVGNHTALDFVNTRLVNTEGPIELLTDTGSLARWCISAGLLRDAAASTAVKEWNHSRPAKKFLGELLVFREQLRDALPGFESGKISEKFLSQVNSKLLAYPRRHVLRRSGKAMARSPFLELKKPEELWSEIANSVSDLLTEIPASRVRKCEGCVVNFYDTSKNGSRRWCSMTMCGNRDKVATYRQKRIDAES